MTAISKPLLVPLLKIEGRELAYLFLRFSPDNLMPYIELWILPNHLKEWIQSTQGSYASSNSAKETSSSPLSASSILGTKSVQLTMPDGGMIFLPTVVISASFEKLNESWTLSSASPVRLTLKLG